ncbi:MAG: AIM24 family protein [Ardenticatenaceae bacterium]
MNQFDDNIEVIDSAESDRCQFDVVAYKHLAGGRDIATAQNLFFANQAGIRLKQVRIQLRKGEAILESSALYFMKGRIQVASKAGGSGGLSGLARGLATKMLTNETIYRPRYSGTGEIFLEPSFGHFLIFRLGKKESLIVDKKMFYCCEGSATVSVAIQKNISSSLFGGEGFFQTKVTGPGICVFSSPVPSQEVLCYDLRNEKLQVDGNFVLMRTDGIRFSVQKSTKSVFGSVTSGEGMLQTFEGTGKVWIAPTQAIYEHLAAPQAFGQIMSPEGRSHTQTN